MERLRKPLAAVLTLLISLFALASCSREALPRKPDTASGTGTTQRSRGPLKVTKVTYLVYCGGQPDVDMYIFTPDLKAVKYSIRPESDKTYDYLAGELPPDDHYEITEFGISDLQWSSIVNVLTRVNYMELEEDMSTREIIDDGSSYYIKVETSDAVNVSGGYVAGYDDDADSRRFAQAREMIENAI